VKETSLLRMRLIPYLYSAFAEYANEGTPPIRAMVLEPGFMDGVAGTGGGMHPPDNPYARALQGDIKDQFMVGRYLLVAPLFAGQSERTVVLPRGKWYDFYTGEFAGDGELISVSPGLDRIPVYVKDGGIVPLAPPSASVDGKKQPLEIRHYGEQEGAFSLYDDDGTSYDYLRGVCTWILLRVVHDGSGNWKGSVNTPKDARIWSYSGFTWNFMTKQPERR